MPRTLDEYLKLPYTLKVVYDNDEENPGWVAQVVELPGCLTQADTFEELGEMLKDAMRNWLQAALEMGQAIPEPAPQAEYSGKFVVRLPRSLHRQLVETAEQEGVSLNQLVNVALAQVVGRAAATPPITYPVNQKLAQRVVAEKK
jgi:antitoxin HicB